MKVGTVSFFFSSRRRHTRYIGDWSSDVCSSDLALSRSIYKSGEQNAHDQPSAAPEYCVDSPLWIHDPAACCSLLFFPSSFSPFFFPSSFGTHSPVAAIHVRGISERHGAWRCSAK